MVLEIPVLDDDTIIALAALGAGLTATGVALGAAELTEDVVDILEDVVDPTGAVKTVTRPVAKAARKYLGLGRPGGIL